jgi:FKBP-type peptidyl-prolyl cis-trans isomerase FklB
MYLFKKLMIAGAATLVIASCSQDKGDKPIADKDLAYPTELFDQVSYSLGHQFATQIKRDSVKLNMDYYLKGYYDGLDSNYKFVSADSMAKYIELFASTMTEKMEKRAKEEQEMQQKQQEQLQKDIEKASKTAKADGEKFLAENKNKPGVRTTPSGLQYKVVAEGSGRQLTEKDIIKIHMSIKALNIQDLQNTRGKEPLIVPVTELFPGWKEGMKMMKKGARYEFYIPSKLAFGDEGFGPAIPPGATVLMDVEVLDFSDQEQLNAFRDRMMQRQQQMMEMQRQGQMQQEMQQMEPR